MNLAEKENALTILFNQFSQKRLGLRGAVNELERILNSVDIREQILSSTGSCIVMEVTFKVDSFFRSLTKEEDTVPLLRDISVSISLVPLGSTYTPKVVVPHGFCTIYIPIALRSEADLQSLLKESSTPFTLPHMASLALAQISQTDKSVSLENPGSNESLLSSIQTKNVEQGKMSQKPSSVQE